MEMNYTQINQFLNEHKDILTFPGLTPDYIRADSLRDEKLMPKFFVYQCGDKIYYHPFHLANIQATQYHEIISAYGYGGPIANNDDKDFLTKATEEYKFWCIENNVIVETIRFHPLSNNWRYYSGEITQKRNTIYVDLQANDILNTYMSSTRWAIRKALKNNVTVHSVDSDTFLNIFPRLYYDRMQEINAKEFYFFKEEYFNALCAMKNTLQFVAVHNEQVIGASIFILQKDILEYHLSANNPLGKKLQANNLMLHTAFLYAKNQDCLFAHLGGGVSAEHSDPLFLFKLSFAGKLADYKIGKYVHNVSVYDDLIAQKLCEVR